MLLSDVLVLDRKSRDKNYSFAVMIDLWNQTGIGQFMVDRVESEAIENYVGADLDGVARETFNSTPLRGLVEKISPKLRPPI